MHIGGQGPVPETASQAVPYPTISLQPTVQR